MIRSIAMLGMHPPPPEIEFILIEAVYFLAIAVFSFGIFFKTRKIYQLTRHKGIFLFRSVFFYFGLSYFFRLIHIAFMVVPRLFDPWMPPMRLQFGLILVGYFSTMAILSLASTVVLKNADLSNTKIGLGLNAIAVLTTIIIYLTHSLNAIIVAQTLIFLVTVVLLLLKREKRKKHFFTFAKVSYVLLFFFWTLNTALFARNLMPLEWRILIYSLSVVIFAVIFFRVMERLPDVKKKRQA